MKRIICKTLIFVFLLLFTILPLSVYAEEEKEIENDEIPGVEAFDLTR